MTSLKLCLLGPPQIEIHDQIVHISRRKALAILAYLAVTEQIQSRDSLAAFLWPDHDQSSSRSNLRRDLFWLKKAVGEDVLLIDRDHIQLNPEVEIRIDIKEFQGLLSSVKEHTGVAHSPEELCDDCMTALKKAVELYKSNFMDGFGLPDSAAFDDWQFFQNEELRNQLLDALQQLIQQLYRLAEYKQCVPYARRWIALDPWNESAHRTLMELYALLGEQAAALRQFEECKRILKKELGIEPDEETLNLYKAIKAKKFQPTKPVLSSTSTIQSEQETTGDKAKRPTAILKFKQNIQFALAQDGVKLAYATVGEGPPLVKAANWLSHLEYEWNSPVWRHWLERLAEQHTLIRYDERGCGLSDWNIQDFSFDAWLNDLETIVDNLGLERFPLLGISQGGPVAIAYAVRHPEKVSHLILYGAYARGKRHRAQNQEQLDETETLIQLIRLGWGRENPAFRQVFTSMFMPDGTPEQYTAFNELQRISSSPENAATIVSRFGDINVTHLTPNVSVPTLVLHARGDLRIPFDEGRLIASMIPGARFVPLESNNHILMEHEPAWDKFLDEVNQFLQQDSPIPTDNESKYAPVSLTAHKTAQAQTTTVPTRLHIPTPPTPFIGRPNELSEIRKLIFDEQACRLLTLVGPGGIGKTRLAMEAANTIRASTFTDGVFFIPLASVIDPENIITTTAEILDINLSGAIGSRAQLINSLQDKKFLLIFDNFEHLLSVADLISEILNAAPDSVILVTSRERLNIPGEWIYEVHGMAFPKDHQIFHEGDLTSINAFSALELFLQRAHQADINFTVKPNDLENLVRITQLVDGTPLGLELAAPWVRLLTLEEIASEIESSIDFLSTSQESIPERHRSLKAILNHTWSRLTDLEQQTIQKLAVFRGNFERKAAEEVTEVSLQILASLMDKALLYRTDNNRLEMHQLVRHYVLENLQNSFARRENLDRHASYYLSFLVKLTPGIKGQRQKETLEKIAAEIPNMRLAWRTATEHRSLDLLAQSAECAWLFCDFRGLLDEGRTAFKMAVDAFCGETEVEGCQDKSNDNHVGFFRAGHGFFQIRQGKIDEGEANMKEGIARLRESNPAEPQKLAFALAWLSFTMVSYGRFLDAKSLAQESLAFARESGDRWIEANSLRLLGASSLENLTDSEHYLRKCLRICEEIGDYRIRNHALSNLGIILDVRGDHELAREYLEEALSTSSELGDLSSQVDLLRESARLALIQGHYDQTIQYIQESLKIYEQIHRRDTGNPLSILGWALRLKGDIDGAEYAYRKGLNAAITIGNHVDTASCMTGLGSVAIDRGEYDKAIDRLTEVMDIYKYIGNEPGEAIALHMLALAETLAGEDTWADAQCHFNESLQLVLKHDLATTALDAFVNIAINLRLKKNEHQAAELLEVVMNHPASSFQAKELAKKLTGEMAIITPDDRSLNMPASRSSLDWHVIAKSLIEKD